MQDKKSTLRNAALFGLIVLFALTVVFIGLDKRRLVATFVCAAAFGLLGLAFVVLTLKLQEPRIHRVFFLMTGISAAALPISVVLHNLVDALCVVFFGDGFWKDGFDEPFFFILAIIVCPALFVIGAVGSIVLLVRARMK